MALIRKDNISVPYETYVGNDGKEKTAWRTIGELLTFDGKNGGKFQVMKLYHMPGVKISLFEQDAKNKKPVSNPAAQRPEDAPAPHAPLDDEEIRLEEVPF